MSLYWSKAYRNQVTSPLVANEHFQKLVVDSYSLRAANVDPRATNVDQRGQKWRSSWLNRSNNILWLWPHCKHLSTEHTEDNTVVVSSLELHWIIHWMMRTQNEMRRDEMNELATNKQLTTGSQLVTYGVISTREALNPHCTGLAGVD